MKRLDRGKRWHLRILRNYQTFGWSKLLKRLDRKEMASLNFAKCSLSLLWIEPEEAR